MTASGGQHGQSRVRIGTGLRLGLALALAGALWTAEAGASEKPAVMGQLIEIYLDVSRVLRVPDGTATLVVGNPLIADVSVETGGLLVVTGKGYGVTNLIAFDAKGALLMEHPIEVKGPADRVTVYRGVERESYSCLPDCERRVVLGDTQDYFANTLGQASTLNTQAQSGRGGGGAGAAR